MFILDHSLAVGVAWLGLKELVNKNNSLDDFLAELDSANWLFEDLTPYNIQDARELFKSTLKSFCEQDQQYQLLRKIVTSAKVCLGCWEEPEDLQSLLKQIPSGLPKYAYISNIIEFMIVTEKEFFSEEEQLKRVNKFINHVLDLEAKCTFMTLTREKVRKVIKGVYPDCVQMIEGSSFSELMKPLISKSNKPTKDLLQKLIKADDYSKAPSKLYVPQFNKQQDSQGIEAGSTNQRYQLRSRSKKNIQ